MPPYFATAATASPPPADIAGIRTASDPTVGTPLARNRLEAPKEDPAMGGGGAGLSDRPRLLYVFGMAVVHRRAREGVRSAWLTDHTRPFVIVLVEAAGQHDPPLGPFGHLGVACASREEIDRLYVEACREARPTRAPFDAGEPIGYVARIADPDGHSLELSFGQEVGLAVEAAAKG